MMIAQTLPVVPESWLDLIVKITLLIGSISALLVAFKALGRAGTADDKAKQATDLGVQAITHAAKAQGSTEAQAASITRLSERSNAQDQSINAVAMKMDPAATVPPPLPTSGTPPTGSDGVTGYIRT